MSSNPLTFCMLLRCSSKIKYDSWAYEGPYFSQILVHTRSFRIESKSNRTFWEHADCLEDKVGNHMCTGVLVLAFVYYVQAFHPQHI